MNKSRKSEVFKENAEHQSSPISQSILVDTNKGEKEKNVASNDAHDGSADEREESVEDDVLAAFKVQLFHYSIGASAATFSICYIEFFDT